MRIVRRAGEKRTIEADRSLPPYFYLRPKKAGRPDFPKEPPFDEITGTEEVELELEGEKAVLLKVFVSRPGMVPLLRQEISRFGRVFEADIPYLRRYCVDRGIEPLSGIVPRVLVFDIETLSRDGSVVPDSGRDEIILISYALLEGGRITQKKVLSSKGKDLPSFVERVESEKALLELFFERVRKLDPDMLAGYNSDNFDLPYISDRARANRIPASMGVDGSALSFRKSRGRMSGQVPEVFGRGVLDVYLFVRYIISHNMHTQTLDLDSVASELLGERKVPFDFADLPGLVKSGDLSKFCEYSLQDSVVTAKLADKLVPIILSLSRFVSLLPAEVCRMTSGQIVEWFLLKESHFWGLVSPNRPEGRESSERDLQRFEGAFVKEPEKGLHDNVAVCDFRSLYPSIIVSHNIDPFTFSRCSCGRGCAKGNVSPTGDAFCTGKFGILPASLRELLRMRAGLKKDLKKLKSGTEDYVALDAKQTALKLIANSFYGYLGYQNSRWYSFEGARSTAAWGRMYIKETIAAAEKDGFPVIYGDTDSLFFSSPKRRGADFEAGVRKFVSDVNAKLPEEMELELQDIYSRGVFLTKKRYAMITSDGRIVIKGLERVRRDWAGIARTTQEEVLLAVLRDADPKKAMSIIGAAVKRLRERKVDREEITIYTQLTKKPSQYRLTSPHVEAAKLTGLPARAGTMIRFIITRGRGSISSRARPADSVTTADYDPEYYIENQLLPPVMRIMEALGYGEAELRQQSSLGGFL